MPATAHGLTYWTREEWGAAHGQGKTRPANTDVDLLVVHHTWRPVLACGQERSQEIALLQGIERFHAVNNGWGHIGYHFLVFQSGNVYEGVGWRRIGAHTAGQNTRSVGVCFVANGDTEDLTPAAVEAFEEVVRAARAEELTPDHETKGHRDFAAKSCPGDKIYDAIVQRTKTEHPTLRTGMRGPDVERVQKLLTHHGQATGADGIFGSQTENAVRQYQATHGLEADGIVGKQTWEKLLEA